MLQIQPGNLSPHLKASNWMRCCSQSVGAPTSVTGTDRRQLGCQRHGNRVYVDPIRPCGPHVPSRLRHRVLTADSSVEGAINTPHTPLHVLGPPVEGSNWVASDGPGIAQDNHHRRGILILDGRAVISRRYAIDWQQIKNGERFAGDPRINPPRKYNGRRSMFSCG